MSAQLLTERRDATLLLTISDPAARNALSPQVSAAAVEALGVAETDASVRAVVLAGEGAHFCAGGNLRRLAANRAAGPEAQAQHLLVFHQFIEALRTHPKPIIAAVEGAAAGGGFSLALACDLIVAAQDARFAMSYGRIGLSPDGGGSWHLARALPRGRALQLLWLGEDATARELQAWGLVHRVTDRGEALAQALRLAQELAERAPNALVSAKELIDQAPARTLAGQLEAERRHFVENLFHANGAEGLQAFFEKRAPRFG